MMMMRFAGAILLAMSCAASGCVAGDDGSGPGAGDLIDERETFAWPDVAADGLDDAGDVAGLDARDFGDTGFPANLPLACKVDGDCVTACGSGPCTDGRCVL